MKYEIPRLTVLMPAINAVQSTVGSPKGPQFSYVEVLDPILFNEALDSYQDWE
jgi:hypothetical protein